MTEALRLGVVGAGAVLQVAHLPVLKKLKSVQVAALCDADLPKARALASRYGIPSIYDDIEDLLAGETLDALLVCTPNHLHEPHILAGLSAGLHVLCEKGKASRLGARQSRAGPGSVESVSSAGDRFAGHETGPISPIAVLQVVESSGAYTAKYNGETQDSRASMFRHGLVTLVVSVCLTVPLSARAAPGAPDAIRSTVPLPGGATALSEAIGSPHAFDRALVLQEAVRLLHENPPGESPETDQRRRQFAVYLSALGNAKRGKITVGGIDITRLNETELARWRSSNIGFIFQFYNLIPVLTAFENVELPQRPADHSRVGTSQFV